MSAASRQRTCAACGGELREDDRTNVEPLVDGVIRYVAVHAACTTHPVHASKHAEHLTHAEPTA